MFEEKEAYLQNLIELLPVGIIFVDAREHRIRDLNSRALRMIGTSREEIVGQVCHGFVCPAEVGRCPITDLGQTVDQSERLLLAAKQERIPVLKSVFSVCRKGETLLVESFIDIRASKEAERVLVEAKQDLEHRVLERTRELQKQVRAKEEAHAKLADAQQSLIELSRQSGMAEVATGVLHNVGNVLNSVNVSATIVANKIRQSRITNLAALAEILGAHSGDLAEFMSHDPKGQRVLPYLAELSNHLHQERQVMLRELELLTEHIGHIKEIVAMQQSYAQVSGLVETVSLADLVEDAIRFVQAGFERHKICIERDYEQAPPVAVEKHNVLQIMLNLLRNAKQALKDSDNPDRRIRVCIYRQGEDRIRIAVEDTGVGIPPENLTRIFSHGFTTRRGGHGFGLHSGANAAQQMEGALWAESEGPGRGATFTLELPLKSNEAVGAAQPV
jgi:two-component system NtrC family sensor kinase